MKDQREIDQESGGAIEGVAVALVTDNKDPEALGRVKVSYPWHSTPMQSYWARIAVPMAGKDYGLVLYPDVGDEVLVIFERKDIRFPYVLGGLWNGKEKPPVANANGKNDIRMLKTRKGHTLIFDDNSSKGKIELKLNDGKMLSIDDDGIKIIDDTKQNSISIDSKSGALSLQASTSITLKAPSISVEASGSLTLKSSATLTIQGAMVSIN
jgi:uncharacterized protein involved in type VI secretion and phage assembly